MNTSGRDPPHLEPVSQSCSLTSLCASVTLSCFSLWDRVLFKTFAEHSGVGNKIHINILCLNTLQYIFLLISILSLHIVFLKHLGVHGDQCPS